MEGGTANVAAWYGARIGRAAINYGATASHGGPRAAVLTDTVSAGPAYLYRNARPEEIERIAALIRTGLDQGALGIGYGIQYTPGATRGEIVRLFRVG